MSIEIKYDKRYTPMYIVLSILSIILLLYSVRGYAHVYLLKDAYYTEATIEKIFNLGVDETYRPTIEYTFNVDGKTYKGVTQTYLNTYREGNKVHVWYMLDNTSVNDILKIPKLMLTYSIITLLLSVLSIVAIIRDKITEENKHEQTK